MGRDKGLLEKDGGDAAALRVAGDPGREEADASAARPALGTLLTEEGLLTGDQIREAIAEGTQTGERLGEVLLRRQLVGEADLARVIAHQWQFPFVPDDEVNPDPTAAFLISPEEGLRIGAIPFGFNAGQAIVGIADPTEERVAAIHGLLGTSVEFVVVTQSAFARLLGAGDVTGTESPADTASWSPGLQIVTPVGETRLAAVPENEPASEGFDGLVGQLEEAGRALTTVMAVLGRVPGTLQAASNRAAMAERQFAESERSLAAERAARADEQARIAALEAELEERNGLFETVRAKLSELSGTLDPSR